MRGRLISSSVGKFYPSEIRAPLSYKLEVYYPA
jgi:hypothetical protein